MKKVLLLMAALFMMGGAKMHATKAYGTLSVAFGATWDSETNTMGWTSTSYNWGAFNLLATGLPGGDISAYTTFHATLADFSENADFVLLRIKDKDSNYADARLIEGENNIDLYNLSTEYPSCDFTNIDDITIWNSDEATDGNTIDADHPASVKITNVYMAKPFELNFDANGNATIDLSDLVATGGLSFNPQTGLLTNNGEGGTLYVDLPAAGIDFSNFTSLTVATSDGDVIDHGFIRDNTNNIENGFWSSKFGVNFTTGDAMKFNNATNVNVVEWYGTTAEGSMTISSITIKASVLVASPSGETVLNTLPWININTGNAENPDWKMGVSTDTYYGNLSSDPTHYVDLTDYEELRIYRDAQQGFRAFFINADASATNNVNSGTWNAEGKYWSIDLSTVAKWEGKVALKSIKSEGYGVNNIVNNIVVYKTPAAGTPDYAISGKGIMTDAVLAALNDPNAVLIDAKGVTGTDVDLYPGEEGNPNCIFVANEGVLANGGNVCVDGNIENLVLQDGYPVYNGFGGPIQTADFAQYKRDMDKRFGTLYLPFGFDATTIDDRNFYTVSGMTTDGGITLQKLTTVEAGVPCIVEKVGDGAEATTIYTGDGESKVTLATPDVASQQVGSFSVSVIGSYKEETINTAMTAATDPVYYGLSNNKLVQATQTLTVKPFRAYVKATPTGEPASEVLASLRLVIEDEEATAIKNLTGNGSAKVVGIFSVNGARQNSLQKGMNVVKFSDGKSQKVLVK